ncbi:zinc metalloproteinase nas-4-like isoform X2 [Plodia interpunctella]|uniref:zinc metalloproteinase nas-4-like isoform X2 n=1 Tax=Plodia interpunctella TaxID=58824 RepID=UPI00236742D2|nr:zinc metalloproteinase nas-4-like isoform X2 [Plodia interpunctella]
MFFNTLYYLFVLAVINAAPIEVDYDFSEKDYSLNDGVGELGNYFEGDMVLTPVQYSAVADAQGGRNGLRDVTKRWPEQIVVYHIIDDDFDEDEVEMIEDGLADIANKSCITFRKRKGDEHAVIIQGSANGCFSGVGYNKPDDSEEASQVLNLAKGCFKHGTIVHEMLHTLGFYHMQSAYDRDEYVEIVWDNIKEGLEHNFAKYNNDTVTDFGVPYDYGSVMHYPEVAFSKNGNRTIIPLEEGAVIGQRKRMSESDIIKLNKMYCE